MNCSNCATENEAGRKFCKECGTALAVSCANCGAANPADAKFCGECGLSLNGPGPAARSVAPTVPAAGTVHAPPSAERRLVSVLFADLVGFTTLAEGRDPEETRELLTRYFGLAREVIDRHGGTVEKFIGDAVMAVWGAPVAREDDAERAVRAGLELIDGVKTLGPGIEARAGVLTGEAAVTLGATGEGMVAGDLVNTASRLQSIAPPGSVVVGETTERAANRAIAFEPLGDQQLKGKSAPVPAFRAVRVVAEIGGRNRAEGLEAPFVGRDDDFRLLKDLFHATGRDRRPRLVSVMGPAGIGKSRLAWEFSKYTDGLVEDTYWHTGRSPSYGEGVTFWALGEMIRRRAELLEGDDEATTRQKIDETVTRWVPDEKEQRWIEGALLALLGLGESLPGGRDELFAAWRTFFERIAEHATTVLLFEDLQWADSGLLDFIDHLFDWTKSLPLFVLTLARPTLLDRRPDWGAGRRNFVSLALDPLPAGPMNQLLEGLVPGLPADIRQTIVARADGVPLYAVETVRMLVAEGKLRDEGGVFEPVGELTAIAIPETLTALIAARLDGLEPAERAVLQAAAVLGQSFSVAALEALSGVGAEELGTMLAGFLRREVLSIEADPRSPERGQYSFVQALIREVAYNQLARDQRKERHLAAARWFEGLGDDELAGVLAEHYAAAYRNAPSGPEADALAGQARIALRAAADRAGILGSQAQAVAFLTHALELTHDPAERAALLERAGKEATDATPESAFSHFEQASDLYRSLGDLHGLARAATGSSIVLHSVYRPAEAIPILEAAVTEASAIASEPDAVRMLSELARAYANARDPRALELVDRVLELAEPLELMPIIAEGLINRALVLNYAGRYYEPATILRGLLPITEAHGLNWSRLRALNNLAVGMLNEDLREAARLMDEAIELSRRTGNLGSATYFQGANLYALLLLGRWGEIESTIAELADTNSRDVNMLEFMQGKAVYEAYRGDDEAATATLQTLRPLLAEASLPDIVVFEKLIEAQVEIAAGRLEAGRRLAVAGMVLRGSGLEFYCAEWAARAGLWMGDDSRVREAVQGLHAVRPHGRVPRTMARQMDAAIAALDGRQSEALEGFREALEGWRDMDALLIRGLCLMDMVAVLAPSTPEATAAADEARSLWTRLGAPPLIARLDELLSRSEAHDGDGEASRQAETAGRKSSAVPRSG